MHDMCVCVYIHTSQMQKGRFILESSVVQECLCVCVCVCVCVCMCVCVCVCVCVKRVGILVCSMCVQRAQFARHVQEIFFA
jgi:hypothetical protein